MAFKLLARTREKTTTTGTGDITVSGLVSTDNVLFSDGMSVGDTSFMCVVSGDGVAWEEFLGTYNATNTIQRTTTLRNNSGTTSHVSLSGTSRIFGIVPADFSSLFDSLFSSTRGSLVRRGASGWEAIAPGTTGDVLTMGASDPDWAAGGGGGSGDLVLISTLTASNSASLEWTGLTDENFLLIVNSIVPVTNNTDLMLQVGEGGTPTWKTGSYTNIYQYMLMNGSNTNGVAVTGTGAGFVIADAIDNSSPGALSANFNLFGMQSTSDQKTVLGRSVRKNTGVMTNLNGAGIYTGTAAAVSALRLIMTSGNISSGKASLYKVVS